MLDSFQISRFSEIIACLTHFLPMTIQIYFKYITVSEECHKMPEMYNNVSPWRILHHSSKTCYILKRCLFLSFFLSFCLSLFLCCYKFHLQWKNFFFNSQDHEVSVWLYIQLNIHICCSYLSSCHTVDDNETCLPWLLLIDNISNICNTHLFKYIILQKFLEMK